MLNCSSMRAAVILSASLLMLGVLLGIVAVTATTTNEATATLAEISTTTRFVETAVATMPASPSPVNAAATPAPQPTPIAAARSPLTAN